MLRRTGRSGAWLLFAMLSCFALAARAEPTIHAELSSEVIGVGEQAVFTLTLSDANGGSLSTPNFGDLQAQGPSQSTQTSISFINGRQSFNTSRTYTWYVSAPREGTFRIGAATLTIAGGSYSSEPVELRCDGQAVQRQAPQQQRRGGFFGGLPDPFDVFEQPDFPDQRRRATGQGDLFLRAIVDRPEPWLGEQVTLSLYLFSQADITGVQSISFPKLDGFWAEDIESPTQLTPEIREVKGVAYRAYLLRRRALFPLRAGELVVDPVEAQVNLGMMGFFGGGRESVRRKSAPLKLQVKSLPAEGQPPGFEASNVGDLRLTVTASPMQAQLGQPVQLTAVLEGSGNLKSVQLRAPKLPAGLKTYDPTVTDKPKVTSSRYGGVKTVEWVVLPERTGHFEVPPVELPYFHPGRGAYDVLRSEPFVLDVAGPASAAPAPSTRPSADAVPVPANVLSSGLRALRLEPSLAPAPTPVWERAWFWPVTAAPPAAWAIVSLVGVVGAMRRRRDPLLMREQQAKSEASRRLKAARALLSSDQGAFHAELLRSLQQFVTDRTGLSGLGLTHEALAGGLRERGLSVADAEAFAQVVQSCEFARYAPAAGSAVESERLLAEATRLIGVIDALGKGRRS